MAVLLLGILASIAVAAFAPRAAMFLGICLLGLSLGSICLSYARDRVYGPPHDMEPFGMAATLGLFGGLPLGALLLVFGWTFRR